ncbi:MAG: hypothetical protein MHM6MM_007598 [Cercozoa sp. M6MM]
MKLLTSVLLGTALLAGVVCADEPAVESLAVETAAASTETSPAVEAKEAEKPESEAESEEKRRCPLTVLKTVTDMGIKAEKDQTYTDAVDKKIEKLEESKANKSDADQHKIDCEIAALEAVKNMLDKPLLLHSVSQFEKSKVMDSVKCLRHAPEILSRAVTVEKSVNSDKDKTLTPPTAKLRQTVYFAKGFDLSGFFETLSGTSDRASAYDSLEKLPRLGTSVRKGTGAWTMDAAVLDESGATLDGTNLLVHLPDFERMADGLDDVKAKLRFITSHRTNEDAAQMLEDSEVRKMYKDCGVDPNEGKSSAMSMSVATAFGLATGVTMTALHLRD